MMEGMSGRTFYRIDSKLNFITNTGRKVRAGDPGGMVERLDTLSWDGRSWIERGAIVEGDFLVMDDAVVEATGRCGGRGYVRDCSIISGDVTDASIAGYVKVFHDATVTGLSVPGGGVKLDSGSCPDRWKSDKEDTPMKNDRAALNIAGTIKGRVTVVGGGGINRFTTIMGDSCKVECRWIDISGNVLIDSCRISGEAIMVYGQGPVHLKGLSLHGDTQITAPNNGHDFSFVYSSWLCMSIPLINFQISGEYPSSELYVDDICQLGPFSIKGRNPRICLITFIRWKEYDSEKHIYHWDARMHLEAYRHKEPGSPRESFAVHGIKEILTAFGVNSSGDVVDDCPDYPKWLLSRFREFVELPD
jgi:hypothetical protein